MKRLIVPAVVLALSALMGLPVAADEVPPTEQAVCRAADMYAKTGDIRDEGLRRNIVSLTTRLQDLCRRTPTADSIGGGEEIGWINFVDSTITDLQMSMADRLSRPISAADRIVLRDMMFRTVEFQRDFELIRLDAYKAVRVETKDVVRTVEVEARCPACPDLRCPEPPPQVVQVDPMADERAGCISAAHDTARQAKGALDKINFANGSLSAIRDLSSSLGECTQWSFSGDPQCPKSIFQRLPGWARMADGILERDSKLSPDQQMSADTRGRVEGVAIALRSQLRTCGRF